jgi:hypothetical protein
MTTLRPGVTWFQALTLAAAGAAAGVIGSVALALAAAALYSGRAEGLQDLAAAVLGMFVGFVLGCPLGVWLSGRLFSFTGSLLVSYAASITAGLLGIAIPNMLPVNAFTQTMLVSVPLLSLVASVAAYLLTHARRDA